MKTFLLICILTTGMVLVSQAQETKEQKKQAKYDKVVAIVEAGKFEFIGRKANPQGGRQIDLTSNPNFLRIDGKKGIADMPYFGRAFSGGYGSTAGIEFDSELIEYTVEKNDAKYRVTIKFQVKGSDDTYKGTLDITTLENVSLTISSNKKQTINYSGSIQKIAAK